MQYDFLVLSPINPATLATYRQAFSPSRATDDPQDADALRALLYHHRDRLKAWQPEHAKTRTRHYLMEHRRRLVKGRTRISQRMTARLQAYVPQVFQWCADSRTPRVCALLLRWPTLAAVQQVRPATLEKVFHAHHSVRKETLANRLAAITAAGPLTTDPAVLHSSVLMITALATQRQTTLEALRDCDDERETLGRRHEDSPLCASLPGAGPVDAARLTAALGTDRDRGTTGDALLGFSGVAPVLERRGKATWMRWRYGCPKFLRQSFPESAGESLNHSCWAKAYDRSQRARGKSHQAAVSALACKWIGII